MDPLHVGKLLIGLTLLLFGAEMLVRAASRLAASLGISPLIIGLTVVAFGTSSPELAVSLQSALSGQSGIAVGNAVGSNIFNILFILGVSALVTPLSVSVKLVRLEIPLMIGSVFLLLALGWNGMLGRVEGFLLTSCLIGYLIVAGVQEHRDRGAAKSGSILKRQAGVFRLMQISLILLGLGLLTWGSNWLVQGSVAVAEYLGLSDLIIGLTIIAAGTSLPEVATSLVAAWRGERDIAVGNVIGSNLFNVFFVLGVSSLILPLGLEVPQAAISFDIPVMIAVSLACLPVFFSGLEIARWEGGVFVAYYVAYILYLTLEATEHDALPLFSEIMLTFVVPLTVVTLIITAAWSLRTHRASETSRRF